MLRTAVRAGTGQKDDRLESTHIVLDVQVAASFEQDTNNINMAFVGSQV